jgi:hypothetical protein
MSELAIKRSNRGFINQVFSSVRKFASDFIAKNGFNLPSSSQIQESRRKAAESIARRVLVESDMLTPFIPESKLTLNEIGSLSEQKAPESFFTEGKLSKEKVQEALIYLTKDKSSTKAYDFHSRVKFEKGLINLFSKVLPEEHDIEEFLIKSSTSQIADVLKRGALNQSMRNFLDLIVGQDTHENLSGSSGFVNQIWEYANLNDILAAVIEKTSIAELSFDEAAQVIVNLYEYLKETNANN